MREVDPKQTKRAAAFELWMSAPMPMVTLIKTIDVSHLLSYSRKHGYKFNMLLCWCIGKAAQGMEEFYLLPVGEKLMQYDTLAVSTVVALGGDAIQTCDIPFSEDLQRFNSDYVTRTKQVRETGEAQDLSGDCMVIGTSALAQYDIDGAVNLYAGVYNNPFLIWGKYKRNWRKTTLTVSFQFHHTQMDGIHAARFLEALQQIIKGLKG